jgi:hypothetical protein
VTIEKYRNQKHEESKQKQVASKWKTCLKQRNRLS